MRRREFISLLGGTAAAWALAARAQQPAMPVVGVMSPLSVATAARNLSSLRNGLRDLGYSEDRNVKIEARFADGVAERFPVLVADLLALKPAVILPEVGVVIDPVYAAADGTMNAILPAASGGAP